MRTFFQLTAVAVCALLTALVRPSAAEHIAPEALRGYRAGTCEFNHICDTYVPCSEPQPCETNDECTPGAMVCIDRRLNEVCIAEPSFIGWCRWDANVTCTGLRSLTGVCDTANGVCLEFANTIAGNCLESVNQCTELTEYEPH